MRGRWRNGSLRLVAAVMLGALLPLALGDAADAQQGSASAELTRVIGRVETLRKGQTQWIPAVIGARLVEGDDIRAFAGAQAELVLPDTSTVVLVENSRLLMTKLEYDRQQQSRFVLLHLVVGKVRASIAQTAITLVRARQSNFAISTPTAVAAARGTIVMVGYDLLNTLIAVQLENVPIQPRIECIPVARPDRRVLVRAGFFSTATQTECRAPTAIPPQFLTLSNPATAAINAQLNAPVVAPPLNVQQLEQLVTSVGSPTAGAASVSFFSTSGAEAGGGGPSSLGVNAFVNQLNQNQNQGNKGCASNGGQQENCQGQQGQQ
jgi:hypothetical protein